ncbi:MAG TPA: calcium-binding protein, partial [Roseomonas sp.]|nr:calcium-binding protein [Roseomonas sp.]
MATITGTSGNDTIYPNSVSGGVTGGAPGLGDDSIDAGNGNDSVFASDGNDTLNGGGGFDRLFGGSGDDLLFGGSGEDRLYGGAGNDSGDGGADFDVLAFSTFTTDGAVSVTVTNVGGVNTAISTSAFANQGSDTFTNIEAIAGSLNGDTINVSSVNTNSFNFHVFGGSGSDVLFAPTTPNTQVFADYRDSSVTAGVVVDLALGSATDGKGGTDTISNFVAVRGTDLDDTLLGTALADRFRGRGGDDV